MDVEGVWTQMIKKLRMKGFQSHADTRIEFDEGVNVIIGQSDSGKTAVLRALDWVLNNRPQGDDFRREGDDLTLVTAVLTDGLVRRWKRKTVENAYSLGKEGPEYQEFKAFGASVPDEIAKTVNMQAVNWQRQLDSPFLLSETAGEVARRLNEIVKLDAIDRGMSRVDSLSRKTQAQIKALQDDVSQTEEQLKSFEYLDQMEKDVGVLVTLESKLHQMMSDSNEISAIFELWQDTEQEIEEASRILKAEKDLKQLRSMMEHKEVLLEKVNRLQTLGNAIKQHNKQRKALLHILEASDEVAELSQMAEQQTQLSVKYILIQQVIKSIDRHQTSITALDNEIKSLIQQMPKVCPTCGRPL
jgi:DNA repair exonuclease SbcCD ATPase subunit